MFRTLAGTAAFTAVLVTTAAGQAPAPAASRGDQQQMYARFKIAAMEGLLERAVQFGARKVSQRVQAVMPEMLFFTGAARARGFWLEGYGVFFDVDVPAMRRSLAWSFRMLEQDDQGMVETVRSLKEVLPTVQGPARARLEVAVRELERQIEPPPGAESGPVGVPMPGARTVTAPGMNAATDEDRALLRDPNQAYTSEVKQALMEAMVEYSTPLEIGGAEWFTVAARDQEGTRLQPGDPYDVSTIVLRIRGADLAAFRSGQIDKAQALSRVEVKEY